MIIDSGLLKNTFYLNTLPKNRIGKINMLIYHLLKKSSVRNFKKIYRAAFKSESKLSVYELVHYLDKPDYDVLHAHFGPNGNYVAELKKLGLFQKAKFITTFHGFDLDQKLKENNFYKELFSTCNFFTVNTNYSKNLLISLGCPVHKIDILPVGLDTQKFSREAKDLYGSREVRILFVGRLLEFKAPDLVIEICNILKNRNRIKFSVKIIGDGPMFEYLNQLINEKDLQDHIELAGSKNQEEIKEAMNISDFFLYPGIFFNSRAENQGLVIQEAQAMEIPVLISDAGGMAEGMLDSITGYVLPQSDLHAFADKVELLANNPDLKNKMGKAGRKFVEEKYDINVLNESLEKIYYSHSPVGPVALPVRPIKRGRYGSDRLERPDPV